MTARDYPGPPLLPARSARPAFTGAAWDRAGQELTDTQQRRFVEGQLAHVESILFDRAGGCQLCHLPGGEAGRRDSPGGLPGYEPTRLPARARPHARFRHAAHRMLGCAECHPAEASRRAADVLVPAIDACARCHNPRAGARHDCAECHAYHPTDH
jgi:hypothetical protein